MQIIKPHADNETGIAKDMSPLQLQLEDDGDDENVQLPDTHLSDISDGYSSNNTRRYPLRQRHAPARYNGYVLSSI